MFVRSRRTLPVFTVLVVVELCRGPSQHFCGCKGPVLAKGADVSLILLLSEAFWVELVLVRIFGCVLALV